MSTNRWLLFLAVHIIKSNLSRCRAAVCWVNSLDVTSMLSVDRDATSVDNISAHSTRETARAKILPLLRVVADDVI